MVPQTSPESVAENAPVPKAPAVEVAKPYAVSRPYSKPSTVGVELPILSIEPFSVAVVVATDVADEAETVGAAKIELVRILLIR